ncbi:hypothetical protein DL771_011530 [Monosporascus sp. 5C6A]|nr:hypothetical protein DL771_011530 [Monosporascus sp. 5C6A]
MGSSQMIGIVVAPILGGVLIDWVGWRGCFGINLPLGVAALALVASGLRNIMSNPDHGLGWRDKLKRFDWLGTVLIIPAVVCLLLGLQWGGSTYGWGDVRIVILFVLSAALLAAFGWRQNQLQENAILPPRIIKMRSVLAGAWFSSCVNATLAVTEYYIAIYFQGVKGYTATHSGLLISPLLVGIIIGNLCGGLGIMWSGYYNPFMVATTVLAPIASGLLSTISLDESVVKTLFLLGSLGLATGVGIQTPLVALQTIMKQDDLSIGLATTGFGATMGHAVWIVVSATIFRNRLVAEIEVHSPSVDATLLEHAGLSEIRAVVGSDRLRDVLLGYDDAVTQTLYLPVGLTVATIFGSVFTEWQSVKSKRS